MTEVLPPSRGSWIPEWDLSVSDEAGDWQSAVRSAVAQIEDPEVPVTLADLGVLRSVEFRGEVVVVRLAPTRMGCPGRGEIARRVQVAVSRVVPDAQVELVWDVTGWRSEDINLRGTEVLAEFGYSLSAGRPRCPYCHGEDVRSEGEFGGSLCKQPFTCRECGSPFDLFKGLRLEARHR